MGSESSKFSGQQKMSPEYKEIPSCKGIFQNIFDGSKIQRHEIEISSQKNIQYEKKIFLFRKIHSDKLVTAYYFSDHNQQYMCSQVSHICYFTEFPKNRLSSFSTIAFERGLQILVESLQGYEILYNKYGYFKVSPQSICFDINNRVKVWIDGNLAESQVKKCQNGSEVKMIKQIFDLFEERRDLTENSLQYLDLLRTITKYSKNQPSFHEVAKFLISQIPRLSTARNSNLFSKEGKKKLLKNTDKENNPKIKSLKNRKKSAQTHPQTQQVLEDQHKIKYRHSQNFKEEKKTKRYNSQEETNPSGFSIKTSNIEMNKNPSHIVINYAQKPVHLNNKISLLENYKQKKMVPCQIDNKEFFHKTQGGMMKKSSEINITNKKLDKKPLKYLREVTETNFNEIEEVKQGVESKRQIKELKEFKNLKQVKLQENKKQIFAYQECQRDSEMLKNLKTVKSILGTEVNQDNLQFENEDQIETMNVKKILLNRAVSQPPPSDKLNKNK